MKNTTSKYPIAVSSVPKSGTRLMLQFFYFLNKYLPPMQGEYLNESHKVHGWANNPWSWHSEFLPKLVPGTKVCGHLLYPAIDCIDEVELRHSIQKALSQKKDFRAIYVYRDPRDALISLINMFCGEKVNPAINLEVKYNNLREMLIAATENPEKIKKYVGLAGWLDMKLYLLLDGWRENNFTLLVRYEDIVGPLGGRDEKIQKIWVEKIVDWIGFSKFKNKINIDELCNFIATPSINCNGHFHKGTTGQWEEVFDNRITSLFKDTYPGLVERLGYSW